MKKRIIKMVGLVILLGTLFAIASCNSVEQNESPSGTALEDDQNIETSDMVLNLSQVLGRAGRYVNYEGWVEAIKDKFDITVKINYISAAESPQLLQTTYLKEAITRGYISGLVRLTKSEQRNIATLREAGLILPLNEYLKGNETFNNIPPEILNPYYINDELWAIPVDYLPTPSIRLMKKSVLEDLDIDKIDKPETLDEFYDVLSKAKKSDKYKNMKGIMISSGSSYPKAYYLQDIFYANACYISQTGTSSISFDPTTNAYEDFMLKPQAADTLSYISILLQNGMIGETSVSGFRNFSTNNNYLSYYSKLLSMTDEMNSKNEYLWYLKGSSDTFLNPVVSSIRAYVMAEDTPDPGKTINKFVDTFLGDEEGYFMGRFGLEGEAYEIQGDSFVAMNDVNYMDITYTNSRYIFEKGLDYKDEDGVEYYMGYPEIYDTTQELVERNMLFETPWLEPFLNDSYSYESLFIKQMANFFLKNGEVDIEEFIDNYISEMKKLGAEQALGELNSSYGYVPEYGYSK